MQRDAAVTPTRDAPRETRRPPLMASNAGRQFCISFIFIETRRRSAPGGQAVLRFYAANTRKNARKMRAADGVSNVACPLTRELSTADSMWTGGRGVGGW